MCSHTAPGQSMILNKTILRLVDLVHFQPTCVGKLGIPSRLRCHPRIGNGALRTPVPFLTDVIHPLTELKYAHSL